MDSRERTFLALDHEEPDRVPVDCWMSPGCREKLQRACGMEYEDFLDAHDVDLRYIPGPAYVGPPLARREDGMEVDIWGVPRKEVVLRRDDGRETWVERYREVTENPLAGLDDPERIRDYPGWPSPDWFDYSVVREQCMRVRDAGRVVVFMGDRLNRIAQLKPAMYLRGVERILLDMAAAPDTARAVFERIVSFYAEYETRILEAAGGLIDILLTGDDFGTQDGLLVSPVMWGTFIEEGFSRYVDIARQAGVRVMHHTCGAVRSLVPALVECGLHVLQSLQPEAAGMDPAELKREFGGVLSFQGGISIQKVLPRGSVEEVRSHVRDVMEKLAPGGGYIACTAHNIQADTPVENIEALFEAYAAYGAYR